MARECAICGSRKWRKDRASGSIVCEEGHVMQDYREEVIDQDQPSQHSQIQRRLKSMTERRRKIRGPDPLVYRDPNLKNYLQLQLYQLLLRYQIKALIEIWKVPPIIEDIVKELWTLLLSLHQLPPCPPSHPTHSPPSSPEKPSTPSLGRPGPSKNVHFADSKSHRLKPHPHFGGVTSESDNKSGDEAGDSGSSTEKEEDTEKEDDEGAEVDPELLEEMSELSDSSSTSGRGRSDFPANDKEQQGGRKKRFDVRDGLTANSTVVVLVLGLWWLRVPVMFKDVVDAINDGTLPFLNFGKSSLIPEELHHKMNKELRGTIWSSVAPTPEALFSTTRRVADRLKARYDISIPELNAAPVLWRMVRDLGCVPEIYQYTYSLLQLSKTSLFLSPIHPSISRSSSSTSLKDAAAKLTSIRIFGGQGYTHSMPETRMMLALLVVLKLAYGLDGISRQPGLDGDLAVGLPDGGRWVEELRRKVERGEYRRKDVDARPRDFSRCDEVDIDEFLDQAERVLLKNTAPASDTAWFREYFPLSLSRLSQPPTPHRSIDWTAFHASCPPLQVVSRLAVPPPTGMLLPGEKYRTYQANHIGNPLPLQMQTVLSAASQLIGVEEQVLLSELENFETKAGNGKLFVQRGIKKALREANDRRVTEVGPEAVRLDKAKAVRVEKARARLREETIMRDAEAEMEEATRSHSRAPQRDDGDDMEID